MIIRKEKRSTEDTARPFRAEKIIELLLRGSTISFLLMGIGTLLQLALQLYLTNTLGGNQYGVFIYAFAWLQVLVLLPKIGLDAGLLRFVAAYHVLHDWARMKGILRRSSQWAFTAGVILTIFLLITLLALTNFIDPELHRTFEIAAICLPVFALLFLRSASLQALKHIALAQLPQQILRPLLTGLGVWMYSIARTEVPDSSDAMLCNITAIAIAFLFASYSLQKILPPQIAKVPPEYENRKWLHVSIPMWLVSGLQQLSNWIDVLLIGLIIGTSEAGIYAVASRMARLLAFGLMSANFISAPMISQLYTQQKQEQLQKMVRWSCLLSTGSALFIGILLVQTHSYILGFFGNDFTRGSFTFLILSAGHIVNALTGPVGLLLNMTGHQETSLRINSFGVATNLVLNIPAILLWGIEGAAVVTSMTIVLLNVWRWVEVYNRLHIHSIALPLPTKR